MVGRQRGSGHEAGGKTADASQEQSATTGARFPTLRWLLATGSLVAVDGLIAFVVGLLLVYVRFDVLQGTWSARISPLELAGGIGLLWVAAMAAVGVYIERVNSTPSKLFVRILVADVVLIGATVVASIVFDLANVSGLLLLMCYVALPIAAIGTRHAPQLAGVRRQARLVERKGERYETPSTMITVIEPPRAWPGLGLSELWRLRGICLVLARRNLMVRYRQTVIGAAWSLLQPILLMTVFTIFFGILGRGLTEDLPFPIFYLLALVPYQMVAKILSEGSGSVVSNSALVTRVYFPRVYFPTSVALASLTDFMLALIPISMLLLYFNRIPGPNVVFAPLLIAVGWIAGLGAAYWLSALNVSYRDIAQLMPFLTQLLMFLSPVIYTSSLIPEPYRKLYFINPLALVVEGFRWALAGGPPPPLYAWLLGPMVAILLLTTGYLFFRHREPSFADTV